MNGLLLSDNTPNPGLAAFKYWYRNVHVSVVSLHLPALTISIQSWFEFRNLSDVVNGRWELVQAGASGTHTLSSGNVPRLSLGFREKEEITLDVQPPDEVVPGAEYWVNIVFELSSDTFWADAGFVVASEQFVLPISVPDHSPEVGDALSLQETALVYRVSGSDFSIDFNKRLGTISSFVFHDIPLIAEGPKPDFWRSTTDNDRGNFVPTRFRMWRNAGEDWEVHSMTMIENGAKAISFRINATIAWRPLPVGDKRLLGYYTVVYTVYGNGVVEIHPSYQQMSNDPGLLRFGMRLALPSGFEEMTWRGLGPESTMPDRNYEPLGLYSRGVDEDFHAFPKPQETGNKEGVRWIQFLNENGNPNP
jgi:beta-galactosidase